MRPAVTLKAVAARAGCSIAVASTVLNQARGNTIVSTSLREKVLNAARALGYRPNHHAQSLKAGRSKSVGILLDPPTQTGHHEAWLRALVTGAETAARAAGYDFVVVSPAPDDATVLERGAQYALARKVDALVAPGAKWALRDFDLSRFDVPLVLLMDDRHRTGLPYVTVDETPGIRAAIDHLAGLGHRRLLWVGTEEPEDGAPGRLAALRAAARRRRCSLDEARVPAAGGALRSLDEAIEHYRGACGGARGRFPPHSAAVCCNDLVAMGLCHALWEAGVRVPHDVSVVGFDDLYASCGHPPLTTVALMHAAVGARAAAWALGLAEAGAARPAGRAAVVRIPAGLVIRGSTGAPKGETP